MRLVTLQDVTFGSPLGRVLASNVSVGLDQGEMLMITGPNGAGKSTLLKIMVGAYEIYSGTVKISLPREKVAYLPQLQNVAFHLPLTLADVLRISQKARLDIAKVTKIGLLTPAQLDLAWNTASGGERKRTLLTRAILRDPRLLILDEPLNHLDGDSRKRVCEVLANFVTADRSRGVILVSHEVPAFSGAFPVKNLVIGKNGGDHDADV